MTRRLPQIAFGVLALATIGAFLLVQELKTHPPLVWAPLPTPVPSVINPVDGHTCRSLPSKAHPHGVLLNYRQSQISISVSNADTVGVYIVSAENPSGNTVATVSSGTPLRASPVAGKYPRTFTWNGLLDDGAPAPRGSYYFRVVLEHEDRSANFSNRPVQVITQPPNARILSVRTLAPATTKAGRTVSSGTTTTSADAAATTTTAAKGTVLVPVPGPAVLSPPRGNGVRITYTRGSYRRLRIEIYRTDVAGRPELVYWHSEALPPRARNSFTWNGEIDGEPAPAGTYLVGITAQNLACDQASWPITIPPLPGTTANAGVTVRYLSVTPPLTPVASGARATVGIDSPVAGFRWRLLRSGSAKPLASGSGAAGRDSVRVRLPRHRSGLYQLVVSSGTQSESVPLVASQSGAAGAHARVLVVLPMLTWMGNTPVDDTGDGIPDTLQAGDSVSLLRPLVDGPPGGFAADVQLLAYLTAHHLAYQLTTDVALAEGVGPTLADRGGVILPAGESFLPAGLGPTLRGFVRGGGRALVLGTGDLAGTSAVSGFPSNPRAAMPRLTLTDLFGARRGPITPTGGELIAAVSDPLELFSDASAFSGFGQYQPIQAPSTAASGTVAAAGIGTGTPAIIGFRDGSGTVIEVGLPGFTASLADSRDSQQFLANAWQLLSQ